MQVELPKGQACIEQKFPIGTKNSVDYKKEPLLQKEAATSAFAGSGFSTFTKGGVIIASPAAQRDRLT